MMIVPGMTFTIEPMINMGTYEVFVDEADGWTVCTDDGLPSAQWENMILITETGNGNSYILMELILLIAIAILVTVLLVLALTKGNNQTQAEQLQIALRQQMQGEPGGTEPQYPGTPHGNDADAQPEYAATSRRSAQKHDDYRRTATAKVRHDGTASRKR